MNRDVSVSSKDRMDIDQEAKFRIYGGIGAPIQCTALLRPVQMLPSD